MIEDQNVLNPQCTCSCIFVLTVHSLLCSDLYSRGVLDEFLSRALNIELENNRLTLIDESNYVLTLDYTIKMLNIHERYGLYTYISNCVHISHVVCAFKGMSVEYQ